MEEYLKPQPVKKPFFTPTVIFITILLINGLVWAFLRFVFGIGFVSNLDNQHPWGIWIGIDVAAGVALAAGGFTTSALVHIFHKEDFHLIVRPANMTAMIGYTFVALGVLMDLGRWYFGWHLAYMWNGSSVLFEVGICVLTYVTTLYIENIPLLTERFIGLVNLPGMLGKFNRAIDKFLRILDTIAGKIMFFFIILGVVLSCLHQSSLGTLMMIAGPKVHPLWQTPISPLLFFLSAISVGFPMVIMESLIASKSFGLKPEMDILSKLGRYVGPLLGFYLAFKIGDMAIRGTFVYLTEFSLESVMWIIEVLFGVILPMRMFLWDKVLHSRPLLLTASFLAIFGVLMFRVNVFLIAYTPTYSFNSYLPSIGEISITVGFIALEILIYRLLALNFPVIAQPIRSYLPKTKYTIRGGLIK